MHISSPFTFTHFHPISYSLAKSLLNYQFYYTTPMQDFLDAIASRIDDGFRQFQDKLEGPFSLSNSSSDKFQESIKNIFSSFTQRFSNGLEELSTKMESDDYDNHNLSRKVGGKLQQPFRKQQKAMRQLLQGFQNIKISKKELEQPQPPKQQKVHIQKQVQSNENASVQKKPAINQTPIKNLPPPPIVDEDFEDYKLPGNRAPLPINPQIQKRNNQKQERNNFDQYKKELRSLQEEEDESSLKPKNQMIGSTIPQKKHSIQQEQEINRISQSNKIDQKIHRHPKNQNLFRVNKEASRKYSAKKKLQAESQLKANIEFLKYMRGVPISSNKKQWKQDSPQKNNLESVKEAKKTKMEQLGFSKGPEGRISGSIEMREPQKSSFLPEIRQTRKNAQAFKPAAFSIYSIMKSNQMFTNNTS